MEAGGIRNRTPNTNTNKHSLQNTTFHISGFLITALSLCTPSQRQSWAISFQILTVNYNLIDYTKYQFANLILTV